MANLLLLVLCFSAGLLARRSGVFPADSHRVLNAWVMLVSLPALVFEAIHRAELDAVLLGEAALLWVLFLVPAAFVWWRAPTPVWASVALCAGLSNTAFVGLPLIEVLGGVEALPVAAVVDQLGSFVALFLLAIPFAGAMAGGRTTLRAVLARAGRAPAMWALVLAVLLRDVEAPAVLSEVLRRLAAMMSPLALASVGWALDLRSLAGNGVRVAVGLAWKLLLGPALVCALLWWWRGALGPTERIVVAQAAMAPMVTAGVVAADFKLEPGLASALVAVGVPLSLVTVPLWWWLLG